MIHTLNRRGLLKFGMALMCASLVWRTRLLQAKSIKPEVQLFVPPEEAQHEHTFMQWPVSKIVHPDADFLDRLQKTIADIANTIAQFEPVLMCAPRGEHAKMRKLLISSDIYLLRIDTEDLWCRDSGPLIAIDAKGRKRISHIEFNGWGGKQIHKKDGLVATKLAKELDLKIIPSGIVGEAGGVEHDGNGLLMAHESSWVNENRNPGMSRDDIEEKLLKAYGADKMIWAPGLAGEDITDYHIDSLARFTGPARVLMNLPGKPKKDDPFHQAALQTRDILKNAGLEVEVIPEPNRRRVTSEDFVPSYVNYYVCNGAVIAPEFGDAQTDKIARDTLARHFPDREIIQLNVDVLGKIGGGIHCATQQMPA